MQRVGLKFFPTAEGYAKKNGNNFEYVYNYTDHLGNVRLAYQDKNGDGVITPSLGGGQGEEILEENNYYPFGLKHTGYNDFPHGSQDNKYKYQYNGKEYQDELGLNMYAMDMRQYDPAIARWVVQDPVVHHSMSPYNAFDNNPVFWADPSGADSIYNWETGQYVINGQIVSFEEAMNYANNGGNADGSNNNTPTSNSGGECVGNNCNPTIADKLFASGLTFTALGILTNNDSKGEKEVGHLLLNFASGTGEEITNYFITDSGGDSFASSLLTKNKLKELLEVVNYLLREDGYDFSKGGDSKFYENKKLTFSPDTAGFLESYKKHTSSNLVQLFVGGAVFDFQLKNGHLQGVIRNETSRNSLYYHLGDNYDRDSNGKGVILSTIKQNIHFKFKYK